MNTYAKRAAKITGAVCAATGMLALSSVVITGAAASAAVGMIKYGKDTVKKILNDEPQTENDIDENENETQEIDTVESANETDELTK